MQITAEELTGLMLSKTIKNSAMDELTITYRNGKTSYTYRRYFDDLILSTDDPEKAARWISERN